ncbi:Hypothetical predicted protein [Cloeon dipterum]|uniref:Uncharacterized protein n=1 Tax=Cloeon dipterum TaxID=197152 RepID=A0A8S1D5C7_9INSE|nr:Hypothetical predicted protein [Cloeon dipterum]
MQLIASLRARRIVGADHETALCTPAAALLRTLAPPLDTGTISKTHKTHSLSRQSNTAVHSKMTETAKFLLVTMFAIWGVGLAMTVNGPDKGGTQTAEGGRNEGRGLFAPRVEYDEWTPLGHGDPLKNDPTYDYVPPVLERVRYWIEPASSKQKPAAVHNNHQRPTKQRPQPTDRRDSHPFLTLVDGPKFSNKPRPPYRSPPRAPRTPPRPHHRHHDPADDHPSGAGLPADDGPARDASADPAAPDRPSEPLQGPMYLIIEGHSKVKTYGASKPANPNAVSESSRRQRRRRRNRRLISSFLKSFL